VCRKVWNVTQGSPAASAPAQGRGGAGSRKRAGANRWLVPRLEDEVESEGYEHLYLARLAASHLFEAATFLRKGDRLEDIRDFVAELDADAQAAYRALLAIAKGETGDFAEQIERARNNFSHYGDLLSDEAAGYENLRKAMQAHADDETVGQIRDKTPPITGYRAMFADDIVAELTFPGDNRAALKRFVGEIGEHIGLYLQFVRAALATYATRLPDDAWDDWHEGLVPPPLSLEKSPPWPGTVSRERPIYEWRRGDHWPQGHRKRNSVKRALSSGSSPSK
jgi:hypothetical protein